MAVIITNHDGTREYSLLESHELQAKNVFANGQGRSLTIHSGVDHRPKVRLFSLTSINRVSMINDGVTTEYTPKNKLKAMRVSVNGNYTDENGQQWLCDEIIDDVYIQRLKEDSVSGQLVKLENPIEEPISPSAGMPLVLKRGDNRITCNANMEIRYIASEDYFNPAAGWIIKTITILPNQWINKVYTLNDELITASSIQEITLPVYTSDKESMFTAIQQAKIRDYGQGDGWIKLISTGTVPQIPIELVLAVKEGKIIDGKVQISALIDSSLSTNSTNPVQNKVITSEINKVKSDVSSKASSSDLTSVRNRVTSVETRATNIESKLQTKEKIVTINASDWSGGIYTLNDSSITATSIQEWLPPLNPSADVLKALQNAMLVDYSQSVGFTKIKCLGKVPSITVTMRVIFRGEK